MNQEKKSPDEFIGLDEEARVVEVLKTSVFGLWQVVNSFGTGAREGDGASSGVPFSRPYRNLFSSSRLAKARRISREVKSWSME